MTAPKVAFVAATLLLCGCQKDSGQPPAAPPISLKAAISKMGSSVYSHEYSITLESTGGVAVRRDVMQRWSTEGAVGREEVAPLLDQLVASDWKNLEHVREVTGFHPTTFKVDVQWGDDHRSFGATGGCPCFLGVRCRCPQIELARAIAEVVSKAVERTAADAGKQ